MTASISSPHTTPCYWSPVFASDDPLAPVEVIGDTCAFADGIRSGIHIRIPDRDPSPIVYASYSAAVAAIRTETRRSQSHEPPPAVETPTQSPSAFDDFLSRVTDAARIDVSRPSRDQAAQAVRILLEYLGDDPARPGLVDTPDRVVRMYDELRALSAEPINLATFPSTGDGLTIATDIPFSSLCEHHLAPYSGTVAVGYLPQGQVLGLSKIPRLIQRRAAGLTIQEDLTRHIARELQSATCSLDIAVIMTASHSCSTGRGIRAHGMTFTTSEMCGKFRDEAELRAEFLRLARHP